MGPEILMLIPVELLHLPAWPDPRDPAIPLFIKLPDDPTDKGFQLTVIAEKIQPERWDTNYEGTLV